MSMWSLIKGTAKACIGYTAGSAIGTSVLNLETDESQTMAGIAGMGAAFVVPAVGSKLFSFFNEKSESLENSSGIWDGIKNVTGKLAKVAVFGGVGSYALYQGKLWLDEKKTADSTVHIAEGDERLQLAPESQSDRDASMLTSDIEENVENTNEMCY